MTDNETYIVTLDKESGQTIWRKKVEKRKVTIWEVLFIIVKVIILTVFIMYNGGLK